MGFSEYVQILRRQWVLVVVIAAIITAAFAAYSFSQPRNYESKVRLYASSAAGDGTPALTGVLISMQSTPSFADFVTSDGLAARVISETGASLSVAALLGEVKAVADGANITITVTDHDPHQAQKLAQAYGNGVVDMVQQLAGRATPGHSPITAALYDPATFSDSAVSTSPSVALVPGALLGVFVGFGAAVLRDTRQRRGQSPATDAPEVS